jgi:hypothetical protein
MSRELENPLTRYFQTRRVVTEAGEWFIEWKPPRFGVVPERLYVVTDADRDRPDTIAEKTLGDVRLWWEIMVYNSIQDPMSLETGDKLRIPRLTLPVATSVAEVLAEEVPDAPGRTRCIPFPPFQDPSLVDATPVDTPASPVIALTLGFPVPPCLSGLGHFQLQASTTPDFGTVVLSKLTQADTTRWHYYDPSANSGAGGFVAFPVAGINLGLLSGQTVYHDIVEDELDADTQYFMRYRVWYAVEGVWQATEYYAPPAINLK